KIKRQVPNSWIIGIVLIILSIAFTIYLWSPLKPKEPTPSDLSQKHEPKEMANFHVIGAHVAFNSRNPNQLIANISIHNNAGEADIVAYSSGGLAKSTADEQPVIKELRKTVSEVVKQGQGLHFTVRRNEPKWFTVE